MSIKFTISASRDSMICELCGALVPWGVASTVGQTFRERHERFHEVKGDQHLHLEPLPVPAETTFTPEERLAKLKAALIVIRNMSAQPSGPCDFDRINVIARMALMEVQ